MEYNHKKAAEIVLCWTFDEICKRLADLYAEYPYSNDTERAGRKMEIAEFEKAQQMAAA